MKAKQVGLNREASGKEERKRDMTRIIKRNCENARKREEMERIKKNVRQIKEKIIKHLCVTIGERRE